MHETETVDKVRVSPVSTIHLANLIEKISEHIERLVVLLKGDEGEADDDNDNVSEDERIEEI